MSKEAKSESWLNVWTVAEMAFDRHVAELGDGRRWQDQSAELQRAWVCAIHETVDVLGRALLA